MNCVDCKKRAPKNAWIIEGDKRRCRVCHTKRTVAWGKLATKMIYENYPDCDLLTIAPPGKNELIWHFEERISRHTRHGHECGDTLFVFLCREATEDGLGIDEYVARLDRAIADIEAVKAGFLLPVPPTSSKVSRQTPSRRKQSGARVFRAPLRPRPQNGGTLDF